MAQARQAERSMPQAAMLIAAALAVALVLALVAAFAVIRPLPSVQQGSDTGGISPALVEAGREWQRQREQQGGFVDPLTQAGRDWQAQREQQAGIVNDR